MSMGALSRPLGPCRPLPVICALWLLTAAPAGADVFIETFNTTSYKDAAQTTAIWDTNQGLAYLPASYVFSQPGGLVAWGGRGPRHPP